MKLAMTAFAIALSVPAFAGGFNLCIRDHHANWNCLSSIRSSSDTTTVAYAARSYSSYDAQGEVRIISCFQGSAQAAANFLVDNFKHGGLYGGSLSGVYANSIRAEVNSQITVRWSEDKCVREDIGSIGEPECVESIVVERSNVIQKCDDDV